MWSHTLTRWYDKPEAPGHPFGLSWSGALGTLGRQVLGRIMEMELGNGEDDVDMCAYFFL